VKVFDLILRDRFRTLIFWVYQPLEKLRPRLDKRVDQMLRVSVLAYYFPRL